MRTGVSRPRISRCSGVVRKGGGKKNGIRQDDGEGGGR